MNPQKKYQDKNLANGRCKTCGRKRAEGDRYFCVEHRTLYRIYNRLRMRKKTGSKPWEPCKPGRPIKTVEKG